MTTPRGFHARLLLEHDELDAALERLIEAFETGDVEVARLTLREFDARLTAHLALEDQLLLPEFALIEPAEVEQIAADHRAIRTMVDELVIGSDLHLTRVSAIRALAETLRAHARREDALLYPWAERTFEEDRTRQPASASGLAAPSSPTR